MGILLQAPLRAKTNTNYLGMCVVWFLLFAWCAAPNACLTGGKMFSALFFENFGTYEITIGPVFCCVSPVPGSVHTVNGWAHCRNVYSDMRSARRIALLKRSIWWIATWVRSACSWVFFYNRKLLRLQSGPTIYSHLRIVSFSNKFSTFHSFGIWNVNVKPILWRINQISAGYGCSVLSIPWSATKAFIAMKKAMKMNVLHLRQIPSRPRNVHSCAWPKWTA